MSGAGLKWSAEAEIWESNLDESRWKGTGSSVGISTVRRGTDGRSLQTDITTSCTLCEEFFDIAVDVTKLNNGTLRDIYSIPSENPRSHWAQRPCICRQSPWNAIIRNQSATIWNMEAFSQWTDDYCLSIMVVRSDINGRPAGALGWEQLLLYWWIVHESSDELINNMSAYVSIALCNDAMLLWCYIV